MNPKATLPFAFLIAILLGATVGGQTLATGAAEPSDDDGSQVLKIKLRKNPDIKALPRQAVSKEKAAEIKKLIAQLAEIDSPDLGISATITGRAFLPLPELSRVGTLLLTDHRLKSSPALRNLVEFGPDALPFLLDALDDKTPTKVKIEHRDLIGSMYLANELWGNPANKLEMKVLDLRKSEEEEKRIKSYAVKIGDVCFVAIGQIVGRGYCAVRYQPTACIVVNSPTEDPKLQDQVRKIWSSANARQRVLDNLLLDYSSEGVDPGDVPSDNFWCGSEYQVQAAVRLLYYYPKETTGLIADRLKKLDVMMPEFKIVGPFDPKSEEKLLEKRNLANGLYAEELIKRLCWCREPPIREAIRSIFKRTNDVDIVLAALPIMGEADRKVIGDRLTLFLNEQPPDQDRAYGKCYYLLRAMAERFGRDATPAFERYLKDANPDRCHSVAEAFKEVRGDWCVLILQRLLEDKRPIERRTYWSRPMDDKKQLPLRVCDAAAVVLNHHRPELKFTLEGEHKDLDARIKVIQERLGGQK